MAELAFVYFRFCWERPLIGLPMTIFFLFLISRCSGAGVERYQGKVILEGVKSQEKLAMANALREIRERDPLFAAANFQERARAAFLKIQHAWSMGDMAPARAFVTDGVMTRFTMQLAMNEAEGFRNAVDDVRVLAGEIVAVECDELFDTLHVRVEASCVDRDIRNADGVVLRGGPSPQTFEEVWTFLRRPGAKTSLKAGLIEGTCPNCGSPLPPQDAAQCLSCKSWVNSGEFDWILSEITQTCEWKVRDAQLEVPGLALARGGDSELNPQFLEERASVAFWRWQQGLAERSAVPLRCMAPDEFLETFAVELSNNAPFYRGCAVGAVDVLAVADDGAWQEAHVLVKWSGRWFEWQEGKFRERGQTERQHVFVLGRAVGSQTDRRTGLRSLRCPNCGAAPAQGDPEKCAFCGTPFNDGKHGWVLRRVQPIGKWTRPVLAEGKAGDFNLAWAGTLSATDAVGVLACALAADGEGAAEERRLIADVARTRGVPPARVEELLAAARAGKLDAPMPKTKEEAEAVVRGLVQMCLADGKVTGGERRALDAFGLKVGLTANQIGQWIDYERKDAYRRYKGVLG
jgi:hypothetical protein